MTNGGNMWELRSNQEQCKQCWTCESMLPGFITQHTWVLEVDEYRNDSESMQAAAKDLVAACPKGAITFSKILHR